MSCKRQESLSGEVLTGDFAEQLKSGSVEWQVLNADKPENKHFLTDFGCEIPALVLVRMENGKPAKIKNLTQIGELVYKKQQFKDYVKNELSAMLGRS